VSPLLDLIVWVLGQILSADASDACYSPQAYEYELCIGGGNPVPLGMDKDYFPVEGTDVSVTVGRKF